MQLLIKFITAILMMFPLTTLAHGYWIEAEGTHKVKEPVTIKLFFGEYSSGERLSGNYLDRMKDINVFVKLPGNRRQPITMKQLSAYWEGTFIPETEGEYEIIGINDEREVQDWTLHNLGIVRPVQYLKTVYKAGTTDTKPDHSLFLDVQVKTTLTNNYEILVFKKDTAYGLAKITITHPAGWEKILQTDKEGKARFTLIGPGLYIIDVEWIDKTPGHFKEKAYESIRHKLDFSLYQR